MSMQPTRNVSQSQQDLMATAEDDIKLYVGEHWPDYEVQWRAQRYGEHAGFMENLKRTNWLAVFLAPIWFLYRKLYFYCVMYFVIVFALAIVFNIIGLRVPAIAYGVAAAAASRYLYLRRGVAAIKQIRAGGLDEASIKNQIAASGGVSMTSAITGLAFIIGMLALSLYVGKTYYDAHLGVPQAGMQKDTSPATNEAPEVKTP